MEKKKIISTVVPALFAWMGTYGIGYTASLAAGDVFSNSIFSVTVCSTLFLLLRYTWNDLIEMEDDRQRRRRMGYAFFMAFLFALTMIMGYQLQVRGMTESGFAGKGLILLRALCLSVAIMPFSNFLFRLGERSQDRKENAKVGKWKNTLVFLVCWLAIFLCFVPVFLAYYPAIMGFDFFKQSLEVMGGFETFNTHHPLIHTWLIWVFFQLGDAVGSYQTGMACYSLLQMLLLSAALAYSCVMIYRLTGKKWPVIVGTLFYGIFPYISILSVGVTKDVIFSALFLVFLLLLVEHFFFSAGKKKTMIDVLLVGEGILMMLFRNNAIYAVAVCGVVFLILVKKQEKLRMFIMFTLLVVGGRLAFEGMMLAIGTQNRGSDSEKYSVLMQQFARVGYYHEEDMEPETYGTIFKYISAGYWKDYNPALADSIKASVAADNYERSWDGQMSQVLKDWFQVGLKYPNEYIDAFLAVTSGYWFWDDISYTQVYGSGMEDRMGALPTFNSTVSEYLPEGIPHETKFAALENVLEEIVSGKVFQEWPVFSVLFKPALYSWVLLYLFMTAIYMRRKESGLLTLFPLLYLMTLFLGR